MGRKEKRDSIRELREAETEYHAQGNARQRAAQPLHDRAREIVARERIAQCGQVVLFADRIGTPSGTFRLTPALAAGVDHAGAISSRVTMTRLVATGIFALALKKKEDGRELFLYIDSPDGQHVEPCPPDKQSEVRRFAAQVTTAARERASAQPMPHDEAHALQAEFEALDRDRAGLDAAHDRLRALEQRTRDDGTLPDWHVPSEERGKLAPLKLYLLRDEAATVAAPDPAHPADARSLTAQLEALAVLRSSGALTEDEFDRAKSRVLSD